MKRYRELCHFVDQLWQPIGFTLYDTQTQCYVFVSIEEFNNMVKQNEVQYFVWDTTTESVAISYTDEELKSLKRAVSTVNKYQTLESYLESDAKAPYYFFDYLTSKQRFVMGLCTGLEKIPITGYVVSMYLIGSRNEISRLLEYLGKESEDLVKEDQFGIYIKYPIKKTKDKDANLKFADMLISTESLKRANIISTGNKKKKKSIVDESGIYDVLSIIKFFDQITEQTVNKYKAFIPNISYEVEARDVTSNSVNDMNVF